MIARMIRRLWRRLRCPHVTRFEQLVRSRSSHTGWRCPRCGAPMQWTRAA